MGKRKGRQSETLLHSNKEADDESRSKDLEEDNDEEKSGFFACYLLTSICPRYKGHTYIGFTVNPRRRIRQHNGEICSGASRTKKKRPWEMVLCIYGFPTNTVALQFEWAWQHPVESLAVRKAAVGFKSLGGLANKIKLAYTMLTLPAWNNLNLTVNFFSTKYTKHYAGCPTLPNHMRVHICSMDELPCYNQGYKQDQEDAMFQFENQLYGDEEEPKKTGEESSEEATICVSDAENHERLFVNIPESSFMDSGYCCVVSPFKEDEIGKLVTDKNEPESKISGSSCPVENGEEATICVSDTENDERLFVNIPESSFMDSGYCCVVSPFKEVENGKMVTDKDGPKTKISGSSGPVEVIDVFSPSPEYRINSRRRKRGGVSDVCPEIIDLTESPICV